MITQTRNAKLNGANDAINEAIIWNALDEDEAHIVFSVASAAIISRDCQCGHLQIVALEANAVVSAQKSWDERHYNCLNSAVY